MKAIMEINLDNSAFDDSVCSELARILRATADKVVMVDMNGDISDYDRLMLCHDENGNLVGSLHIVGRKS
jgi:hypothetical protein